MNKQEFMEKAKIEEGQLPDADYEIVEFVYVYHPAISAGNGKQEIANIFKLPGGMRIIRDMVRTAQAAKEIQKSNLALINERERITRQLQDNEENLRALMK